MKRAIIALSILCSLILCSPPGVAGLSPGGYTPPPDDEKSRGRAASGSRGGCPVELGEIALVAGNPTHLETSLEHPTLLYRVVVDTPTDFLITVADREDRQVFEYRVRLTPGPSRLVPVTVERLEIGQKYNITAGLVCIENEESTKVIISEIGRVERETPSDIDALARRYREAEKSRPIQ
jgi:Domain of Unknown Function (DUF928)